MSKQEIIRRLLTVRSYTPEDFQWAGVGINEEKFENAPFILMSLSTVAEIIELLCDGDDKSIISVSKWGQEHILELVDMVKDEKKV